MSWLAHDVFSFDLNVRDRIAELRSSVDVATTTAADATPDSPRSATIAPVLPGPVERPAVAPHAG